MPPPVSTRTCLAKEKHDSVFEAIISIHEKNPFGPLMRLMLPQPLNVCFPRWVEKIFSFCYVLIEFNLSGGWVLQKPEELFWASDKLPSLPTSCARLRQMWKASSDIEATSGEREKKKLTVEEAALWYFGRGLFFWCWVKNKNFKKANYATCRKWWADHVSVKSHKRLSSNHTYCSKDFHVWFLCSSGVLKVPL